GIILFTPASMRGPLMRVAAAGGTPAPATALDASKHELGHSHPHFLPDGRRFLFTVEGSEGGIYAGALDSTKVTPVVRDAAGHSVSLPSGHLVFVQRQTLMAAPFDLERLQTSAMPTLV